MLVAAVLHGCAGAWTIANEYVRTAGRRTAVRIALVAAGAAMVVGGTLTLLAVLGR
jgi:succinate dehydrogenase hydrophobic anchor subunit